MSVMLCTGAIFLKKNSCLVLESFDTVASVSTYFPYFRAIPIQRYSHINGINIIALKSCLNQCF